MILQVLAVRDRAADVFGHPMFVAAVGIAARSFSDEVNAVREGNALNAHPEDFDLYHLATYDDRTGRFECVADGPRQIAIGKDVVRK